MQDQEKQLEVETTLDLAKAADYLQDIARSLREGRVVVSHADQKLELTAEQTVAVKIKAKQKDHKESVQLKVSWRRQPSAAGEADINISAQ
jgi:amphi-Trp domain-containing protein